MSSYTKSTDFASKDALLTGNPLKVVKGTEIDDEFNAIQTAVNSKADTNSPALTGTPTAPTAATTTNTTQIASTAFVQQEITANAVSISEAFPIGSIYMNASSATNPATLLGFGTWVAVGEGRMLVGKASSGTFSTAGATGGTESVTLTTDELPAHTHTFTDYTYQETGGSFGPTGQGSGDSDNDNRATRGLSNVTNSTGSGDAFSILNPYLVVYMWKRTA